MSTLTTEQRLGRVEMSLPSEVVVGSYQDFTLTYHTGFFGVDDSGSIKVCYRYATDMGVPQFDDPSQANYVKITSNASVTLVPRFDTKDNVRPWGKTIYIKVTNGYLTEGDRIDIRFGDTTGGSPGFRMQTFCEGSLEYRVLADVFACYRHERVPAKLREDGSGLRANEIGLVPDEPVRYRGQIPSTIGDDEQFSLRLRAEDKWGNPAIGAGTVRLSSEPHIAGLPDSVSFAGDTIVETVEGLRCTQPGALRVSAKTDAGIDLPINPAHVVSSRSDRLFWADLHGQSEETIGTNSVYDYFAFARDKAWVDIASHQGNDFQITGEFWEALQNTTRAFNEPGRFVTFPGYEWSANTGLGGDHNVFFFEEGETIHRSCHALVEDTSDIETDCNRIDALFEALSGRNAMVFAHVGGRYAVLPVHDPILQRSVEIHSAWGTFEWLLHDAFELGHRVGVVCNSDGHKGRPGASYPGASLFGSYGGLTCISAESLTREAVWEAYRRRHHYGTTGARMILSVTATLDEAATLLDASGASESEVTAGQPVMMGDIVQSEAVAATVRISVSGSAPIERVELRNGHQTLETIRPYQQGGRRIRIVWEGAAFRGRGRQVDWNGGLAVRGNAIESFAPFNFYNPDRVMSARDLGQNGRSLEWESFTTGGISGVIITVQSETEGSISLDAGPVRFELPISDIGVDDAVFPSEGIGVGVRVCRLPDQNDHLDVEIERRVELTNVRDDPVYVCVVQEDGHMAWSSPIYFA